MSWKFWKKDEPKFVVESQAISMASLSRWYLYDTEVAHPNEMAKLMGLMPTSEEGEESEIQQSIHRQENMEPYHTFITAMSEINANAMVASNMLHLPFDSAEIDSSLKDELVEKMHDLYSSASFLALYAGLSAALELGILVNPGVLSSGSMEFPNE